MSIYDRQLAVSGGVLHHIGLLLAQEARADARPTVPPVVRCAWCDREAGRQPHPGRDETHGICPRHHAGMRAELEALRRMNP